MINDQANGDILPHPPGYYRSFFPVSVTLPGTKSSPLQPPPIPTSAKISVFSDEVNNPSLLQEGAELPYIEPLSISGLISQHTDNILSLYSTLISELVEDSTEKDKMANLAHSSSTATVAKMRQEFISLYKLCDDLRSMQAEQRIINILERKVSEAKAKLSDVEGQVNEGKKLLEKVACETSLEGKEKKGIHVGDDDDNASPSSIPKEAKSSKKRKR